MFAPEKSAGDAVLPSQSDWRRAKVNSNTCRTMRFFSSRSLGVLLGAASLVLIGSQPGFAQSGGSNTQAKPPENAKAAADAAVKETQKKINEIAEARRLVSGAAGNPECVWLGRRVVNLLWRDDLDTAFRHLDLYDRFTCPSGHIQATFRCLVRQGNIDPKAQETLNGKVHGCWLNPSLEPQPAAAAAQPPAATSGGTTQR